jgi:hypothetical protein
MPSKVALCCSASSIGCLLSHEARSLFGGHFEGFRLGIIDAKLSSWSVFNGHRKRHYTEAEA